MASIAEIRSNMLAVLRALYPETPVHDQEEIGNPLEAGFYVIHVETQQSQETSKRYKRKHAMEVRFIPEGGGNVHAIAERLYDALVYLPLSGRIMRGTATRHSAQDGLLHFYVDYAFHVFRSNEPEETAML